MTVEEYAEMYKLQNEVCAICKRPETSIHHSNGKVQNLTVDHDHKTNKIRALLCSFCNRGLGLFKENIAYLESAIAYLTKYNNSEGTK